MMKRYETTSTNGPEPMTLIFPEGGYEALPFEVRLAAPWVDCSYGDMASLKPAYRLELLRQGYLIIKHAAVALRDAA